MTTIHPYASFNPEFNILLAASLDSLAKYWDLTKSPGSGLKGGQRLGEFLVTHADPNIWGRCSRLALLRSLPKGTTDIETISPSIHHDPAEVFTWRDDPKYSDLVLNDDLSKAVDGRRLRKSRYGEILYSHYRCGWLHALNPDSEILTEGELRYEPHYCCHNGQCKFVIPTKFVMRTFEAAICSFQKKAPKKICLEA
ncbi:MAG: hypothetical protein M1492_14060 [Gammaproteobacteria bacterium]|nr:hypothetical protein [Gammaproteobacteria bacterium]